MGVKNLLISTVVAVFLIIFSMHSAFAFIDNFQEYQNDLLKELAEKHDLKPGDIVDTTNWQKVKGLIPDKFVEYVKVGDIQIKIGKYEFDAKVDEAYRKASLKNAGKYKIKKETGEIVKADGSYPRWIYGYPFPDVEKNLDDPLVGSQMAFNHYAEESRSTCVIQGGGIALIGRETGLEREIEYQWNRYYLWQRADGEQKNPGDLLRLVFAYMYAPYDMAGFISLTRRPLGSKPDSSYNYLPAIRRIRKLGAADRSQSSLGTDAVSDDSNGWSGRNHSMHWKFLKEQIALMNVAEWSTKNVTKYKETREGWVSNLNVIDSLYYGLEDKNWKGAPWAPLNYLWVPVRAYVVEIRAKDPYYAYGPCKYWVEKHTYCFFFKEMTNRAGEHWKLGVTPYYWQDWWSKERTQYPNPGVKRTCADATNWLYIDDRLQHASMYSGFCYFKWPEGKLRPVVNMDPKMKESYFTLRNMRAMAK
ncbi:MAG: DUF1329 domain-containing protein [Thermodesulfobacteriota bacterium]|nr:DUF1329 domain-containing protein [Thermodesulfobacteriota bacterium]